MRIPLGSGDISYSHEMSTRGDEFPTALAS